MKFIKEPIENCPLDDKGYFKIESSLLKLKKMVKQLPIGYSIVIQGLTKEGDIFYGWDEWDIENPLIMPKYRQVYNHGVNHFHGVARPTK